jgi:hypothetical protein
MMTEDVLAWIEAHAGHWAERKKHHERRTEAYGRAAARVAVSLP